MGVPKFFRYISERYPCLIELVKEHQVPDFDNMYLDMNGIIHTCSHPDDSNPHFRITEEKIFESIFHYISMLYQLIKPRKLFFMAIDGVAPRAKMNQQRGRRFRSAQDAEKAEKQAQEKGEVLPTEKRFDSNCITPGTVFMARLHEQLRFFIRNKISTDPNWAKCKFVLSGHETPGEGEHKIMDYIRYSRSQSGYDPNTKHCLYGLDADLIILGLSTHEPHFTLLREEVKFGRKSTQQCRITTPEETNFFLLHLSLMKDYLGEEFKPLEKTLKFEFDLDKIIDDWILMGFLVGNDFIPNLPQMHISSDELPTLYKTYMKVLPTLDGYINEAGVLNLSRFQTFMAELAIVEKEKFQDDQGDLKYFEGKTGRKTNPAERKSYKYVPDDNETFAVSTNEIKSQNHMQFGFSSDLPNLIKKTKNLLNDNLDIIEDDDDENYTDISDEDDEGGDTFEAEFLLHKKDYYISKLDYSNVTKDVLKDQAECYVRAIQWNLHYYYHGCVSWSWFYPHHYAPYISDITNFKDFNISFEIGQPFKPFEQLLAVLPAASKDLLPQPFHSLMVSENSPIYHYYPLEFKTDLNGKKNDWEALVLIPFIDEESLLKAMAPCYTVLTEEEKRRNTPGPMLVYTYTPSNLGEITAPNYFPPIKDCHAVEIKVWREDLEVPLEQLKKGPLPNPYAGLYFPGFPTMKHLKFKSHLEKKAVRVFDHPSRNDNMILEIAHTENTIILEQVAANYLGKVVWVGWPRLTQAKVIAVSNKDVRIHYTGEVNETDLEAEKPIDMNNVTREIHQGGMLKQWILERNSAIQHNMNRMGIDLGEVSTLIHAVNLKGYKYCAGSSGTLTMGRLWCEVPCFYALHAVIPMLQVHEEERQTNRYRCVEEAFKKYDQVFVIAKQYYGCMATVLDSSQVSKNNRIKVSFMDDWEPKVSLQSHSGGGSILTKYLPGHHIAARCGVSSYLLSRITGVMFVYLGEKYDQSSRSNQMEKDIPKLNVGLNLKFNKKNEEVVGYTKRCQDSQTWLYSAICGDIIEEYVCKFTDAFDRLSTVINNTNFFEEDLFPGEVGKGKIQEMVEWLSKQPHTLAARRACGASGLEPIEIAALAKNIDTQAAARTINVTACTLQVKTNLLFKPELHFGNLPPDIKADYKIYDRVVNASNKTMVPLGFRGTIVEIEPQKAGLLNSVNLSDNVNTEVTYMILFDKPFIGAMPCQGIEENRLYRLQGHHLLNISYGRGTRHERMDMQNSFNQQGQQSRFHNSPTVLRPNGGHPSAFASYSPTKESRAPEILANANAFSEPPPSAALFQRPPPRRPLFPTPPPSAPPPLLWRPPPTTFPPPPPDRQTHALRTALNIRAHDDKTAPPKILEEDTALAKPVESFFQNHANLNSSQLLSRTFHNSKRNDTEANKSLEGNWRLRSSNEAPKAEGASPKWSDKQREKSYNPQTGTAPYPEIKNGLAGPNWRSNLHNMNIETNDVVPTPVTNEQKNRFNNEDLAAAGRQFNKALAQITLNLPMQETKLTPSYNGQNNTAPPLVPKTQATAFVPLQVVAGQRKNQGNSIIPKESGVGPQALTASQIPLPSAAVPSVIPINAPAQPAKQPVKMRKSRMGATLPNFKIE